MNRDTLDEDTLTNPPLALVNVEALEAGEDFAEFIQEYYPHLVVQPGKFHQGRLICFDFVPELIQKIKAQIGGKVFLSEGRLIVPADIPENHSGAGTFQLSAEECLHLVDLLREYGFSAAAEKRYDPLGYWDYVVFSVPPIPELELAKMQYRRRAL